MNGPQKKKFPLTCGETVRPRLRPSGLTGVLRDPLPFFFVFACVRACVRHCFLEACARGVGTERRLPKPPEAIGMAVDCAPPCMVVVGSARCSSGECFVMPDVYLGSFLETGGDEARSSARPSMLPLRAPGLWRVFVGGTLNGRLGLAASPSPFSLRGAHGSPLPAQTGTSRRRRV